MKRSRRTIVPAILLLLSAALLSACSREETSSPTPENGAQKTPAPGGPLTVYTTFYPTAFFTTRIGGVHVKVVNPVPPDADPIFWVPPREVIRDYQEKADLIVLNGGGYARWVQRVLLPEDKVVNAGAELEGDLIVIKNAIVHSHGPAGKHSHEGIDPHLWMDPLNAQAQCRAIAAALSKKDPEHKTVFEKNLKELLARLDQLDGALRALSKNYDGRPILASHPAYNYLARRYGWKVSNFGLDPETVPDEETAGKIKKAVAKENPHPCMLWESEPSEEVRRFFEEKLGLDSLVFSPCETPPGEGKDYFSVMEQNVKHLAPLFR